MSGGTSATTMVLLGVIQNQEIKILVDSGSSHTFISSQLAASLTGIEPVHSSLTVQVANGSKLQCVEHIPQASWSLSGYSFWSNLKILPLSGYDMILGLDWLQCYSPMKVHWGQKSMLIPYKGTTILLCGDDHDIPAGSVVQVHLVEEDPLPDQSTVPPLEIT